MEIQPAYAPDVKIAGAALGGLAPNATHTTGIFPRLSSKGTIANFLKQSTRLTDGRCSSR